MMSYANAIKAAKLAAAEAIHHAETETEVDAAISLLRHTIHIELITSTKG